MSDNEARHFLDENAPELCECGWPDGTFACRIRHQTLLTGDAKAARDFEPKGAPRGSGVTSYRN